MFCYLGSRILSTISGAFNVTFSNIKLTLMASHHGVRLELPVVEDTPPKPEPSYMHMQIPSCVVLMCLPVLSCALVAWSCYTHMPHVGTVVHLAVLELAPAVLVSTESSVHSHVAVLSIATCYSLSASTAVMHEDFVSFSLYFAVVFVLIMQAMAVLKYRPVDMLLTAATAVAILSALLLRLLAPFCLLVQITKSFLIVLCLGGYVFMLPLTAPVR